MSKRTTVKRPEPLDRQPAVQNPEAPVKQALATKSHPEPTPQPHGFIALLSKYRRPIEFALSSFGTTLFEYVLYWLVSILTVNLSLKTSLILANVISRVIGCLVNYLVNRRVVFDDKASAWRTGTEFFILQFLVLVGDTVVLKILAHDIGLNRYLAKVLADLSFFLVNWSCQRFYIFRPGRFDHQSKKRP